MTTTRIILIAIAVVAVLGIADTSYLTNAALRSLPLPCTILDGCNEVARSPYSRVFGVPLSLFGLIFYAAVLALSLMLMLMRARRAPYVLLLRLMGTAGFLLSIYFTYLQAFKIGAFCIYCIASVVFSTLIFALSFFVKKEENPVV